MTSKKHRLAIEESLSSALEPPKKRQPSPALNDILSQYAPAPAGEAEQERTPRTPRTPPTPATDATHTTHATVAIPTKSSPVAPERDFTRVPNSVVRDVVPGGHFVGKSKQLYDYLYQRTRGAVVPVRSMTISKPSLMRGCGIGSERTLLKNLGHLKDIGLVRINYTDGKHEGNSYEVFTPEEAGLRTPRTPPTPPTEGRAPHARTELPPVPPVESGVRGVGSKPLESTVSSDPKTSFKTNTEKDDDEAFAALREVERELTGRSSSPEQWRELTEVLVTELRIAAGRTTVSSVPAFLAEHLRRRLFKKDKRQIDTEAKSAEQGRESGVKTDASQCPDCFGAGMWYPEGYENGVAKCRHEKLADTSRAQ